MIYSVEQRDRNWNLVFGLMPRWRRSSWWEKPVVYPLGRRRELTGKPNSHFYNNFSWHIHTSFTEHPIMIKGLWIMSVEANSRWVNKWCSHCGQVKQWDRNCQKAFWKEIFDIRIGFESVHPSTHIISVCTMKRFFYTSCPDISAWKLIGTSPINCPRECLAWSRTLQSLDLVNPVEDELNLTIP